MREAAVVLKPSGTIHIANQFSLVERKLLNTLIYHAQQRNFSAEEHSLPMRAVMVHLGLESSRNYEHIRQAIRVLVGTIIEWNIFNSDRTDEWGVCTFLSSGKLRHGKLYFRINPEIISKIRKPRLFARMQMLVQAQIGRRHALVLYEFLLDHASQLKTERLVIPDVSLARLHQLLGLEKSKYAEQFKIFNRDILKPAVKEINTHCDIAVEIKPVRRSRRVVALQFEIRSNSSPQSVRDFDAAEDPATHQHVAEPFNPMEYLQAVGVSSRVAKRLTESYPRQRIRENGEYLDRLMSKGRSISNPAAYLVKAIEENYAGCSASSVAESGSDSALPAAMGKRPPRDQEPHEMEAQHQALARKKFASLSATKQEQLRAQWLRKHSSGSIRCAFNEHGGWDNPIVHHAFADYLVRQGLV